MIGGMPRIRWPHVRTAALGGELFAALGHQTDVMRTHAAGALQHFGGDGAFKVHAGTEHGAQLFNVGVLNMTAIFAQMQRDQVGASVFGSQCGLDRKSVV